MSDHEDKPTCICSNPRVVFFKHRLATPPPGAGYWMCRNRYCKRISDVRDTPALAKLSFEEKYGGLMLRHYKKLAALLDAIKGDGE